MSSMNNKQAAGYQQQTGYKDLTNEVNIFDNYEIEQELIAMFPNINSRYIQQICNNPPFYSDGNDLEMFVNHLLNCDEQTDKRYVSEIVDDVNDTFSNGQISDNGPRINDEILLELIQQDLQTMEIVKQNEQKTNDLLFHEFLRQEKVNEKIKILENILPDANPEFLRKYVDENYENPMLLDKFVESSIVNKNYEKRDKYFAKIKKNEKIVQYTTGFTVEEFIKEFPEPFEYFENIERKVKFEDQAFKFLKKRYTNYSEQYLENIYHMNHYNLSLADKQIQLEIGSNDVNWIDFNIDNTALLQEIAFIQNKYLIKLHLDHEKEKEEKEFQLLRAKKLLLECQCCYEEIRPTKSIECDNSHIFCEKCVIKGTNLAISKNQPSVQCFVGCSKEINLNRLRKVLSEKTFEIILKKHQEAEVKAAQLMDLVTCPFCPFQMELAPQLNIFTCKNPECMKITCRLCRQINHLPIKCEDVINEHKGRLYIEEEMSKGLIRNCYKCRRPFVKHYGCNTITCICGAKMCYICRLPIDGFSHSNCKRHNNSNVFDQRQVELRRAEATAKLRSEYPDMDVPTI